MVRKISSLEYLKRYDNMTAEERGCFKAKVAKWLGEGSKNLEDLTENMDAKLKNVIQLSVTWNDSACTIFEDGVKLVSAFAVKLDNGWWPEGIYTKSTRRAVKWMRKVLNENENENSLTPNPNTVESGDSLPSVGTQPHSVATLKTPFAPGRGELCGRGENGNVNDNQNNSQLSTFNFQLNKDSHPSIPRPQHIDQYVHLLPKETQERAAMVKDLLRQMDVARENVRLLMNSDNANAADLARWSKLATDCDNTVHNIYKELDAEWEKLVKSGRVVVDDLGYARVIEVKSEELRVKNESNTEPLTLKAASKREKSDARISSSEWEQARPKVNPEPAKCVRKPLSEAEKAARAAEKEEQKRQENQRKAALIRKWLIDTRNAKTKEQVKKWKDKYKQMIKLGGPDTVTQKVKEAAEFYDIKLEKL